MGVINEQPRRAVKGLGCVVWYGVVGLLMGWGARAVEVRSGSWCSLMKKSPSSLKCNRFWPWTIACRENYPCRTGRNEQGFRDPSGNYGLSCSVNISKKMQKLGSGAGVFATKWAWAAQNYAAVRKVVIEADIFLRRPAGAQLNRAPSL